MKCYQHHQSDAVGICRFCARGICPECAVEVGRVLACKGPCEQQVGLLVGSIAHSRAQVRLGAALFIAIGLMFLAWSALGGGMMMLAAGAVFLVGGSAWAVLNKKRF